MFEAPNLNPARATLRQFGQITVVALTVMAGLAWWRLFLFSNLGEEWAHRVAVALVLVMVVTFLSSSLNPGLNRPLWVLLSLVSYPVGLVVSLVVLLVLYFLVITPIGVVMRLVADDFRSVKMRSEQASYWQTSSGECSADSYYNQF